MRCTRFAITLAFLGISLPLLAAPKEQAVTLQTKDGWSLAATYLPANGQDNAVVLLHDLGKSSNDFSSFRKALAKDGFAYLAVDLRGHGQSISQGTYKTFAKEGTDNPFNKMTQDAQAATEFLQAKGFPLDRILLLGTGLGANVAAKTAGLLPDIGGLALISPNVNIRDVLCIPSLKLYKGDVLIAASAGDRKGFLEASILRNVAFLSTGDGKVTFLTAYDFVGHELLDRYITSSVLQWIRTPHKPETLPEAATFDDGPAVDLSALPSTSSLTPSVLKE